MAQSFFHTRYKTTHVCWRCTQKWGQMLFDQLVNCVEKPSFKEKNNQYWGTTLMTFHHDSVLQITEIAFTCCRHFEGQVYKTHFQCKMLQGFWEFPAYIFSATSLAVIHQRFLLNWWSEKICAGNSQKSWHHHAFEIPWYLFFKVLLVTAWPSGLILGLRPANERRRYFVTTSLIGWAQT